MNLNVSNRSEVIIGGFIAHQPNGLYCRFSTVADCPTHYNMTREDYLSNFTGTVDNRKQGEMLLEYDVYAFSSVLDYFVPNNMTQEAFDELVKVMSSKDNPIRGVT